MPFECSVWIVRRNAGPGNWQESWSLFLSKFDKSEQQLAGSVGIENVTYIFGFA